MTDLWEAPTAPGPVVASVSLPGSKSLTNRALILGALAAGPSTVRRPLRSRDTELMAAALTALGAAVDLSGDDWGVMPLGGSGRSGSSVSSASDAVAIDCGLAGTVARFVPPIAGLVPTSARFDGDTHLRQRPMGVVIHALRALGVEIGDDDRGAVPFTVYGVGEVPGGRVVLDASDSSQFVSALLLSGARFRDGVEVVHDGKPVPSMPHIEMTVQMLREHGVEVDDSEANRWRVAPGEITPVDHSIEPDLSNAAPFLALAAATGGTVLVQDWPEVTTQAGDALREILPQMGCTVRHDERGLEITGPEQLDGVDLDLHDVGELTPVVVALCALAGSPSTIRGVSHIRGHETDRLAALARELTDLGGNVTEHPDGLDLSPAQLHGGTFHTYADHRMAHAGAVLGAVVPGVSVQDIATTAKTFPGFERVWLDALTR